MSGTVPSHLHAGHLFRRTNRLLAALHLGGLPIWAAALAGRFPPSLGPVLHGTAVLLLPLLTSAWVLSTTYFVSRGAHRCAGLHRPQLVLAATGSLFLIMALLLAAPSLLQAHLTGSLSSTTLTGPMRRPVALLRQAAMSHPEADRREAAARRAYLLSSHAVLFRDALGRPRWFRPSGRDHAWRLLWRWGGGASGFNAHSARWLGAADLLLILCLLAGLPLAARAGWRQAARCPLPAPSGGDILDQEASKRNELTSASN
ncbi:MAG: hypothetical protein ACE5HD_04400 [Acidobacteriota bacterium]